jgi:RNA-directed DNA polymerase
MMYGHEKSDPAIVAVKPANKAELAVEQSTVVPTAAESAEPRAGTKGNASQQTMLWAQSQISMPHALERIRKVARERKKEKFISLFHHIGIDLLGDAFYELKVDAAPGVDRLTWKDYEADIERNLEDLHKRVQSGAYRARPSRRVYIPKPDGRTARGRCPGGQDCPTGCGRAAERDLRGRFPRGLIRVPTGTRHA